MHDYCYCKDENIIFSITIYSTKHSADNDIFS